MDPKFSKDIDKLEHIQSFVTKKAKGLETAHRRNSWKTEEMCLYKSRFRGNMMPLFKH